MRIGVFKLGMKLEWGKINPDGSIEFRKDNRGAFGEANALIDMLYTGGAKIDICTLIDSDSYIPSKYSFTHIGESFYLNDVSVLDKFDAIVVINGSIGGPENNYYTNMCSLATYWAINNFNGPVNYLLCDPALVLKSDIRDNVSKFVESEELLKSSKIIKSENIKYIVQPNDIESLVNIINSDNENVKINIKNVVKFEFEKFPCLVESNKLPKNNVAEYDFIYGGSIREGRRASQIAKFMMDFSDSISSQLFGKIDAESIVNAYVNQRGTYNYKLPHISGLVDYDKFCQKMNTGLCTLVIGDEIYEKTNDIAQRCYESMCASTVTFIDSNLDKDKEVFKNCKLRDFMYVSSGAELNDKITYLKMNPDIVTEILDYQYSLINIDKKKYCEKLIKLLNTKNRVFNVFNIEFEGIDKCGKDYLTQYFLKYCPNIYTPKARGILSQVVYTDMYGRYDEYNVSNGYLDNTLFVYLKVDEDDWNIRCALTNEPRTNYEKSVKYFDCGIEWLKRKVKDDNQILEINTSHTTAIDIVKLVKERLDLLNHSK